MVQAGLNIIFFYASYSILSIGQSMNPAELYWKKQRGHKSFTEKSNVQDAQKIIQNVMKLYFFKVSWKYENHSASQFSLLIYNHLSHAYIQYIKI